MTQDDSAFTKPHRVKGAEAAEQIGRDTGMRYREFSTHDFKTHFSKLLRQMSAGEFDAAIVTSYGRPVGAFIPHPKTKQS